MRMADSSSSLRTWAVVGLLVGGILVLTGAFLSVVVMGSVGWSGMMGGMMGGAYSPAGGWSAWTWWIGGVGVVTGALLLLAAQRVNRGGDAKVWGVVGIAAGAVSLTAMGGFMLGALAGIVGGALAVSSATPPAAADRGPHA